MTKEHKIKKYRFLFANLTFLAGLTLISNPAQALNVPKEFNKGLPGYFAVPDCQEIEKSRIHSRHFSFKKQFNRSRLSLYQIENINQDFFIFRENGASYAGRLFEDGVVELSSIEKGDDIKKDKDWESQNIIQRHEYMGCFDMPDSSVLATSLTDIDTLYSACKEGSTATACQTAFFSVFDKNDDQYLTHKEIQNMLDVTLDIGHYFSPLSRPTKYTATQRAAKLKTMSTAFYHALNKEDRDRISIYEWTQYHILPIITQFESQDIAHNLKRLFPVLLN